MDFFASLAPYRTVITNWQNLPLEDVNQTCGGFCQLLRGQHAQAAISDPENAQHIAAFRAGCAGHWSALNCHMESVVAQQLYATTHTYAQFQNLTARHWLLGDAADLIAAENAVLQGQGLSLSGLKVCMVGPGAIPYTGLAMAHAGAQVSLVDMDAHACTWSRNWLARFFPHNTGSVHQTPGQAFNYSGFDLVIVASMLFGRADVLARINTCRPRHLLVRTTEGPRPVGLVLPSVPQNELALLQGAQLIAKSTPPLHVGNVGLLYRYYPA